MRRRLFRKRGREPTMRARTKARKVLAKWSADGRFYPGRIIQKVRKNAYIVKFDDGDTSTVTAKNIYGVTLLEEDELFAECANETDELRGIYKQRTRDLEDKYDSREAKLISKHRRQIDRDKEVRELRATIAVQQKENQKLKSWLRKTLHADENTPRPSADVFAVGGD